MKRATTAKFPSSVQLFKFCHKVLSYQRGGARVNDQEVGSILEFNPSDCSHWKRGEKSVRSVFSLKKLADAMQVEAALVHDVASGACDLDESFFEFLESRQYKTAFEAACKEGPEAIAAARRRVEDFVNALHAQCDFSTPPFYLPEALRHFAFIATAPVDMVDRLSRVLRVRPGQYAIQFKKGDLKPQTRMSMAKDFARIIFEVERARFPELGPTQPNLIALEELVFVANLFLPKGLLLDEMAKLDSRRNIVADLSALFWVPKSLVGFQLQDVFRSGERPNSAAKKAEASARGTIAPSVNKDSAQHL